MTLLDHAINEVNKTLHKLELWSKIDNKHNYCTYLICHFFNDLLNIESKSPLSQDIKANILLICNDLVSEQLLLEENALKEKQGQNDNVFLDMMNGVLSIMIFIKISFKNILLDKINDENIIKSLLKTHDKCSISLYHQFSELSISKQMADFPSVDITLKYSVDQKEQVLKELLNFDKSILTEENKEQIYILLNSFLSNIFNGSNTDLYHHYDLISGNLLFLYQEIVSVSLYLHKEKINDDQLSKLFKISTLNNLKNISKYCCNILKYKIQDIKKIQYLQNCGCQHTL
ncbi:hypothetical protein AB837_00568 [bacterium AB1]|nr:hypothetical protein AB837_00568 [bacterium AB1]